jgi:hypothetical protein
MFFGAVFIPSLCGSQFSQLRNNFRLQAFSFETSFSPCLELFFALPSYSLCSLLYTAAVLHCCSAALHCCTAALLHCWLGC